MNYHGLLWAIADYLLTEVNAFVMLSQSIFPIWVCV